MTDFDTEIILSARQHGLDPALVAAVITVESAGDPWAWNPEPRYRYFWDVRKQAPFRAVTPIELMSKMPPADFPTLAADPDQEWWAQQASWGLMQIMGAVAREHACRVPYLGELLRPALNLHYGCLHLAELHHWARGNTAQALGAYNAGKGGWASEVGQRYAAKVLAAKE